MLLQFLKLKLKKRKNNRMINFLVKVRVSTTLARRLCYFIKHMELVLGGFLFIFRHIFGLNTAVYMKYLLISRESYRELAFCKSWDGMEWEM